MLFSFLLLFIREIRGSSGECARNAWGTCECSDSEVLTDWPFETINSTCLNCSDVSGALWDDSTCTCSPYSILSPSGFCSCAQNYLETSAGSCIRSSRLTGVRNESLDVGCGLHASPDAYGVCSCDQNFTEHLSGSYCVSCLSLSGPGADTQRCTCHPYAKADHNGVCQCLPGFRRFFDGIVDICISCDKVQGLLSLPESCSCRSGSSINEFGVCTPDESGSSVTTSMPTLSTAYNENTTATRASSTPSTILDNATEFISETTSAEEMSKDTTAVFPVQTTFSNTLTENPITETHSSLETTAPSAETTTKTLHEMDSTTVAISIFTDAPSAAPEQTDTAPRTTAASSYHASTLAPTITETEGLLLTTVGQDDLLSENFTAPGDYFEIVTKADGEEIAVHTIEAELQDFTESWTESDFFDLEETVTVAEYATSAVEEEAPSSTVNDVFTIDSHVSIDETTAGAIFTQSPTTGSARFSEATTQTPAADPISTSEAFTDLPTVWDDAVDVSGTGSSDDPLFDFTSPGTITSDVFTEAAAASAEITTQQTTHPSTTAAQSLADLSTSGDAHIEVQSTTDELLLSTFDLAVTTDNYLTTNEDHSPTATASLIEGVTESMAVTMTEEQSTTDESLLLVTEPAATTDNFLTTKGSMTLEDQATTDTVTITEVATEHMAADQSTQNVETTSHISVLSTTVISITTEDILQETGTSESQVTSLPVYFSTTENDYSSAESTTDELFVVTEAESTTSSYATVTQSNATAETQNGISTGSGTQTQALELTSSAEALLLTQTEPITNVATTQLGQTSDDTTQIPSQVITTVAFVNESVVDWTFVDNQSWSPCSVTCGYGGVRTRTQVCNTDNCVLGSTRTVTETCNAASSCFAIVTNNVSMSFDLTVTFSTNSTYNSSTADNIDMITSGIRDALESIASYLGSFDVSINVQASTARRRRAANQTSYGDYHIETEINLEDKLEKDKIRSLSLLNVSDFLETFNLLLGDNGYQVQSESLPEVAVEENMLSDSSFDPTDGITCADINAEPVGAECVCKYGFKDFGVGCRRTQPLTLLRTLDNVFFRIYHSHILPEAFKSDIIKRFSRAHMIARYQWKLTKMAEVHGPKSSSMKRCSQESVSLATTRYERELRLAVADVDLLTIEIEQDLQVSPSKFDSQEWLQTELCSYIGRIHSSLIEFIHITSFKCRKAGFLWPKQTKNSKKALKGTFHHKLKKFLQC